MVQIPGVRERPWWDRDWLTESCAAVVPVIALTWSAYQAAGTYKTAAAILLGAAFWLVLASILKVVRGRRRDQERERIDSPADLLGCAHVLHQVLAFFKPPNGDDELRVTIHRVVPPKSNGKDPELLEQVIPYVGGAGGSPGRKFPIRCGIIGRAARSHEPFAAARQNPDYKAFLKELKQEWGYSNSEARALSEDRWSWMAVPIHGENVEDTIGVVYLDSKRPDYFDDQSFQELLVDTCIGIANYIRHRYD